MLVASSLRGERVEERYARKPPEVVVRGRDRTVVLELQGSATGASLESVASSQGRANAWCGESASIA